MTLPNKKITNRILYKGASDVCSFLSFFASFMRLFLHGEAVNSNMPLPRRNCSLQRISMFRAIPESAGPLKCWLGGSGKNWNKEYRFFHCCLFRWSVKSWDFWISHKNIKCYAEIDTHGWNLWGIYFQKFRQRYGAFIQKFERNYWVAILILI